MNEPQPQAPSASESGGSWDSLENAARGFAQVLQAFLLTTWLLVVRRRRAGTLIASADSYLIGPFTYLVIASLPGSLYYRAAAGAFAQHSPTYQTVGQTIATNVEKLLSNISVTSLILAAIPIIVVSTLIGSALSALIGRTADEKRTIRNATCYSLGFAMLCMACGGIAPLLFRAWFPSAIQIAPGLAETGVPIPAWAALSGVPFALYGLYSSGDILASAASGFESRTVLGRAKWYVGGLAGLYACLLSVWLVAIVNWPAVIAGQPSHIAADPNSITCRAQAIDIAKNGAVKVPITIDNESDDSIYLLHDPVDVWRTTIVPSIKLNILSWSGNQSVLVVRSHETSWATPPERQTRLTWRKQKAGRR